MIDIVDCYLQSIPIKPSEKLAFVISKTNFITYNTSVYNILYIKTFIFLTLHLYIHSLLFFLLFLSLSLSLSNFSEHRRPPNPPSHTTTTTYTPIVTTNQIHCNYKQWQRKKSSKTSTLSGRDPGGGLWGPRTKKKNLVSKFSPKKKKKTIRRLGPPSKNPEPSY